MTNPNLPVALLGPQRHNPDLVSAFDELGIEGPVAAVTAGWQEREGEVEEMREHLGRPVVNLFLHERSEKLFAADPRLAEMYRTRQEHLKELQEVYRLRLAHTLKAAREVMARPGERWLLTSERRSTIQAVRTLDAHHLRRVRSIHADFEKKVRPFERPAVKRHRHEIARLLAGCEALAIAGGHVAVLLNRLRLFGVSELASGLPVIAWSAGAMVLGEKVVLFHDHPPQGAGDAEVLEAGLGLFDDILPLPHASSRLRLEDPVRVALFARRFSPTALVALDPGARLVRHPGEPWMAAATTCRLTARGKVTPMPHATPRSQP